MSLPGRCSILEGANPERERRSSSFRERVSQKCVPHLPTFQGCRPSLLLHRAGSVRFLWRDRFVKVDRSIEWLSSGWSLHSPLLRSSWDVAARVPPGRQGRRVTGLGITGVDAVLTGVSTSYTVAATFADGTSRTVSATWSSSNQGVATVDGSGRLEARTHGSTNLTASAGGQTASKTVQVINNYGGTLGGDLCRTSVR
jgi:Bacterial Ig-like domain (group 2)